MDNLFLIGSREGYEGDVGVMVGMLQNARHYLVNAVREMGTADLDARPGGAINTIGSILEHLDAAENMFQRLTFENRRLGEKETRRYGPAFRFEGSDQPKGRPLESYLEALRETRARTLEGMKLRGEAWLAEPKTFSGRPANVHYYWLHFLQDEARHTGQIILIRKHLIAGASSDFDPYVF